MHKYTSKDPLPLPRPLDGKGFFTRLLIPDDGDKRKAAIYGAALEAAANALEWIRHRLVNGLEGGTYDGPLSFTNLQTIGSRNPNIHVTSGLDVDGSVKIDGGLDVGGAAQVEGGLDVDGDIQCAQKVSAPTGDFGDVIVHFTLAFSGFAAQMTGLVLDSTIRIRTGRTIKSGPMATSCSGG
jgi:hypothetical protein